MVDFAFKYGYTIGYEKQRRRGNGSDTWIYNRAVCVPLEIEHASVAFEEVWRIIDDALIGVCGKYLSNI